MTVFGALRIGQVLERPEAWRRRRQAAELLHNRVIGVRIAELAEAWHQAVDLRRRW